MKKIIVGTAVAFPAGTDVVMSNGDGGISEEVGILHESLSLAGFESYAYNTLSLEDGRNVMVNGGQLMHMEISQGVRFDAAALAIADAITMSQVPEPATWVLFVRGWWWCIWRGEGRGGG